MSLTHCALYVQYIDLTRWLAQEGKVEEAKKALERLRGKGAAIDKVPNGHCPYTNKDHCRSGAILRRRPTTNVQELQEIQAMVEEDKKIAAMTEGSVFK